MAARDGSGGDEARGGIAQFLGSAVRAFVIYFVLSQVLRTFVRPAKPTEKDFERLRQERAEGNEDLPQIARPAVREGDVVNLKVFVTEADAAPQGKPDWEYSSFIAGSSLDLYDSVEVRVPDDLVSRNASLRALCVFEYAAARNEAGEPVMRNAVIEYPLFEFRARKRSKEGNKLLFEDAAGKSEEETQEEDGDGEGQDGQADGLVPHWKGNVTISMVPHDGLYAMGQPLNPPLDTFLRVDESTETYAPFVLVHNFWLLEDQVVQVTRANASLSLGIRFHELELWKAAVYMQMEKSWALQESMGLSSRAQADDMKRMFLETNPVFLAVTTLVSLLHTVFDMLAFRSDIGFWSKNESMKGLSARSILTNCFCQVVIFLYLLENETSNLILFSNGLGLMIEFWKVSKATKLEVYFIKGVLPFVRIGDKDTYAKTETKTYDQEASRYLAYVLYPLVAGYAAYSLVYETHTSWYAWILSSLVGAVYTFGFILMCPQLYINYRMKSVAHLPWRQMTYKFLNTIIDDLFAFVIKMPTLHRLSVFRDDLIFIIYLYQRWVYRVDKSRTNEFGYTEEKKEENQEEDKDKENKKEK